MHSRKSIDDADVEPQYHNTVNPINDNIPCYDSLGELKGGESLPHKSYNSSPKSSVPTGPVPTKTDSQNLNSYEEVDKHIQEIQYGQTVENVYHNTPSQPSETIPAQTSPVSHIPCVYEEMNRVHQEYKECKEYGSNYDDVYNDLDDPTSPVERSDGAVFCLPHMKKRSQPTSDFVLYDEVDVLSYSQSDKHSG